MSDSRENSSSLPEAFWISSSKWDWRRTEPRRKRKSTTWWKSLHVLVQQRNTNNSSRESSEKNKSDKESSNWKSLRKKVSVLSSRLIRNFRTRGKRNKRVKNASIMTSMGLGLAKRYFLQLILGYNSKGGPKRRSGVKKLKEDNFPDEIIRRTVPKI